MQCQAWCWSYYSRRGLNSPVAGGILLCAVVEPLNHARISSVTPARIPSGGDSLSLSLPPPLSMENSLSFSLGSIERGPGKDVKRGRGNWLWSLYQIFLGKYSYNTKLDCFFPGGALKPSCRFSIRLNLQNCVSSPTPLRWFLELLQNIYFFGTYFYLPD